MSKSIMAEALEAGNAVKAVPIPIFSCIIDGEEKELTALDFAFSLLEGHKGSMGGQCGVVYEEVRDARPLSERLAEVDRYFEEEKARYNSPEETAKREAAYQEIQRIGQLRAQDFYAGRDMDRCHPLPWQHE